ncbi:hypothetical protein PPTG_21588 [Phytophthora nicotianae INRA-310]|uniref:Uncharacterized protein n=1 Tax=Phytophthora nicotianae (strain INRA-310) TaxID=761204 RepID=W2QZS6_PHYN3|nr:hypothetical protein PPTG_21588 [Phytophthora nicotianae INRA-310]ETN18702.1 hypothetical protein PPTG_21588 [Phytophthora nicotianae INRA-310]
MGKITHVQIQLTLSLHNVNAEAGRSSTQPALRRRGERRRFHQQRHCRRKYWSHHHYVHQRSRWNT